MNLKIVGKVINNIHCKLEAKKAGREEPKYGSIRIEINAVLIDQIWYSADYSRCRNFRLCIPILEISYLIGDRKYWMVEGLGEGSKVEMTVLASAIYQKENHARRVKRDVEQLICKIDGNELNIPLCVDTGDLSLPEGEKQTIASFYLINKILGKRVQAKRKLSGVKAANEVVAASLSSTFEEVEVGV